MAAARDRSSRYAELCRAVDRRGWRVLLAADGAKDRAHLSAIAIANRDGERFYSHPLPAGVESLDQVAGETLELLDSLERLA